MKSLKIEILVGVAPLSVFAFVASGYAIEIKGKLPADVSTITAVPVTTENATESLIASDIPTSAKFSLSATGSSTRLLLTKDNATLPVLLGVLSGKKILPVAKAIKKGVCASSEVSGLTVLNKSVRGKNSMILKVGQVSGSDAYAYLSNVKRKKKKSGKKKPFSKRLKKYVDKTATSELNSDCSPLGNATTLGLAATGSSSLGVLATDGDSDSDGLADEFDTDSDGDGVLNNYDSDYSSPTNSFGVFGNLKVGIESTVNANTGTIPTQAQIDALVTRTNLAMEVKADEDAGETSELNCGSLTYCSTGGTGGTGPNPPSAFPDDLDSDGDGFGDMTKGDTGDFQLTTNVASESDLSAGDSFIQIVTDSAGEETEYVGNINFVFITTPAVKSLVNDPDGAGTPTYTPSYPVSIGEGGTSGSCFQVAPSSGSGDVILRVEAWKPQRRGLSALGEGDFVDLGNSQLTIDIPNGPTSGGSPTSGPGNCPPTSYSIVSSNLSFSGDTLLDSDGDQDADPSNTVTFDVNITDCMAKNGSMDTFDSGEDLTLDLQFRSAFDNAAQKFCISLP